MHGIINCADVMTTQTLLHKMRFTVLIAMPHIFLVPYIYGNPVTKPMFPGDLPSQLEILPAGPDLHPCCTTCTRLVFKSSQGDVWLNRYCVDKKQY